MEKVVIAFAIAALWTSAPVMAQDPSPVGPPTTSAGTPTTDKDPPPPPPQEAPQQQPQQMVVYVPQQQAPAPAPAPSTGRPQRVPYEGGPIPENAQLISRRRLGLLIPGIVMFAVPYIFSVASYSVSQDTSAQNVPVEIVIPFIGPFLAMGDVGSSSAKVALGFDGAIQTVGLALFIGGLVPKKYLLYQADAGGRSLALAPWIGRGAGASMTLDF